jgi:hypothetical protein
MRNFGICAACLALLAVAAAPFAKAQGVAQALSNGADEGPDGFQLYSISAYSAYSSTTVPFGSNVSFGSTLPTGPLNLGPNYLAGVVARVGWRKSGARTNMYVTYTPSYDASLRYSHLNSMNHYLSFGIIRDLAPGWTLTSSGAAFTARWDQFLFSPTLFSSMAGTPATFEQLQQAILSGKYSSSQLASILTGSPLIESPASSLIYGPRIFSASQKNQITYEKSARFSLHWGFGATRTQHLNSGVPDDTDVYLIPQTTTAFVSTGITYSLSPLTTLEFEATSNRTFSRVEDVYISNGIGTISRVLGRRWLVEARGGAGIVNPVRQIVGSQPGPHYLAGGTLTYKTYAHTFLGSYDRTITDEYGLGAHSAQVGSGAWNWHIPGRTWTVSAIGRYELLNDTNNRNLDAWLTNAGIGRRIGMHTTVQMAYVYGRIAGVYSGSPAKRSLEGVQLILSWSPHLPLDM